MNLGLLVSDPERALDVEGGRSLKWVLAMLAAFSLLFGVLSAINIYVIGASQFELIFAIMDQDKAYDAGSPNSDWMFKLGEYLLELAMASVVAGALLKIAAISVMTAATWALMKAFGSKAEFIAVLRPAVLLMTAPLIIFGFSTALNAASYLAFGIVPLLNTALIPTAGWILFFCVLSKRYLLLESLPGPRRIVPLLPLALMAAWNVLYAASILSWPIIQDRLLEQALEMVFG